MGYNISEWPIFEMEGLEESFTQDEKHIDAGDVSTDWSEELQKATDKFTEEANRVVDKWVQQNPDKAKKLVQSDDYESEDDIAWNTWAGIVGHGVGFWEHMSRSDYDSLKAAIDKDKKLKKAYAKLGELMDNAVYTAVLDAKVAQFTGYVEETLVPDLKESGREFTAEDFETLAAFLDDTEAKEINKWKLRDFVKHLEGTLIPDLKESGAEYTAEDFERGIELLREQGRVAYKKQSNPTAPTQTTSKLKSKLLR